MDNITYGQLVMFHTIEHEQSLSGAARKLGITVPAVSKSLRLLEKDWHAAVLPHDAKN